MTSDGREQDQPLPSGSEDLPVLENSLSNIPDESHQNEYWSEPEKEKLMHKPAYSAKPVLIMSPRRLYMTSYFIPKRPGLYESLPDVIFRRRIAVHIGHPKDVRKKRPQIL